MYDKLNSVREKIGANGGNGGNFKNLGVQSCGNQLQCMSEPLIPWKRNRKVFMKGRQVVVADDLDFVPVGIPTLM